MQRKNNLFFRRSFEIISDLQTDEIICNLKSITQKYNIQKLQNNKFEGKIENDRFQISPIFDFGAREQLRPKIKGTIKNNGENKLIELNFEIPNIALYFLILIVNLCVMIYLYVKPIENEHLLTWKFFLTIIILTFIFFLSYLNMKINKAIKILSRKLEGNIKNIC